MVVSGSFTKYAKSRQVLWSRSALRGLSLNISEGDRLGLVGSERIAVNRRCSKFWPAAASPMRARSRLRKNTRLSYVSQDSRFADGETVRQVIRRALDQSTLAENEARTREAETLGRAGFRDFDQEAAALSGGWRKRLALAEALVANPGYFAFGRADQPSRSRRHRVARKASSDAPASLASSSATIATFLKMSLQGWPS